MRRSWLRLRSLLATAAEPLTPIATIFVGFPWSADVGLTVLAATRPHIELYRGWMEDRGLAASTIDRRLSTVCGYYDHL